MYSVSPSFLMYSCPSATMNETAVSSLPIRKVPSPWALGAGLLVRVALDLPDGQAHDLVVDLQLDMYRLHEPGRLRTLA